ncbi:hypothetical protein RESH_01105 [Rhodopirellula europaea SH398]|uniref:Uncharacterized protein n=1 Tax=Rhodopirellula europaea SH398 TaxID=1263868 RepID=M5SPX2_9BACT|nr:hypothetical protein RESH_01105 [Rhodopirellula europaea SH398]
MHIGAHGRKYNDDMAATTFGWMRFTSHKLAKFTILLDSKRWRRPVRPQTYIPADVHRGDCLAPASCLP